MKKIDLLKKFNQVRKKTISICNPLEIEDYVVQPNQEVSPIKWHLGHSSWFFEEIIILKFRKNKNRFNETYNTIFNSYYKSLGNHWKQSQRGQLSRPTVKEIIKYRNYINEEINKIFSSNKNNKELNFLLELGINHEEQHQELMFMDIKYILNINLNKIKYTKTKIPKIKLKIKKWKTFNEGLYDIGAESDEFAYDNEKPKHKVYIHSFKIHEQFITNKDYKNFIEDKGYQKPEYWLSKGWDWINFNNIKGPKYWQFINKNSIKEYTLHGLVSLNLEAPVCHISYYEASAYAKWANSRLPTEEESEIFLNNLNTNQINHSKTKNIFHASDINLCVNNLWWWTKSHYSSYPGFRAFHENIEEYNEKFMCGQFVLKGGCINTSSGHIRSTYRNFYEPHQRWMFSGIRLARDI